MINKIICGNAVTELKRIEDKSIDLIITSPPYYDQRKYSSIYEIGQEELIEDYLEKLHLVFNECFRICKDTGNIVFNLGDKYIKGSLKLIPYRFALEVLKRNDVKLINDITWSKSNPTPRQYKRRLVSSTEPFFHFAKSNNYYYNIDNFLKSKEDLQPNKSLRKGGGYTLKIQESDLSPKEKLNALYSLLKVQREVREGKISDFRMKIRGVHKKAFGGQQGGRNSQIDKDGFTIIRMYGNKMKKDLIENAVANTKDIEHPAVFPLKVIEELVSLLSMENDVVLDPFCGSGQVCIAAKSLNRKYLGIDLNQEYCELSEKRLIRMEDSL